MYITPGRGHAEAWHNYTDNDVVSQEQANDEVASFASFFTSTKPNGTAEIASSAFTNQPTMVSYTHVIYDEKAYAVKTSVTNKEDAIKKYIATYSKDDFCCVT